MLAYDYVIKMNIWML